MTSLAAVFQNYAPVHVLDGHSAFLRVAVRGRAGAGKRVA